MSIFYSVEAMINRYGCDLEVSTKGKTVSTRAFIEPLRYKNKVYIGGQRNVVGLNKTDKYLYIGSANTELYENISVIQMKNNKYIVKRCEKYYVNNTAVYMWAVLAAYGEALEDEYESY